jgi:CheY-like chemotaxis protein
MKPATALSILCVDDEPGFLQALRRDFRKRPYRLVTASSGEKALALARETRFDAAVLDVTMPGMSGHELLKALRLLDPELPIVILTGRPEDEVLYRSVRLGCDGFLEKPCDADALETQLAAVIADGKERRESLSKRWWAHAAIERDPDGPEGP